MAGLALGIAVCILATGLVLAVLTEGTSYSAPEDYK